MCGQNVFDKPFINIHDVCWLVQRVEDKTTRQNATHYNFPVVIISVMRVIFYLFTICRIWHWFMVRPWDLELIVLSAKQKINWKHIKDFPRPFLHIRAIPNHLKKTCFSQYQYMIYIVINKFIIFLYADIWHANSVKIKHAWRQIMLLLS